MIFNSYTTQEIAALYNSATQSPKFNAAPENIKRAFLEFKNSCSTQDHIFFANAYSVFKSTLEAMVTVPHHLNPVQNSKDQEFVAQLILFYEIALLNIIAMALQLKPKDYEMTVNVGFRECQLQYNYFDAFYFETSEGNEHIKSMRDKFYPQWMSCIQELNSGTFSASKIKMYVAEKNAKNRRLGGLFNGAVIQNEEGQRLNQLDKQTAERFYQACRQVARGVLPRTQFMVYVNGRFNHVDVMDVQFNPGKKRLEIISLDTVNSLKQWKLLKYITDALVKDNIAYKICASQTRIQKDRHSCADLSMMLASVSSRQSFSEVESFPAVSQPAFHDEFTQTRSMEELSNVVWFDAAHLGDKIALLAQSRERMLEMLTTQGMKEDEAREQIATWVTKYQMDPNQHKYYLDYRKQNLQDRYERKKPFDRLTLQNVLHSMSADNSPDVALRRFASGMGTVLDMEFLINHMVSTGVSLDTPSPKDGSTALHWSIKKAEPRRALLLLYHHASTEIKDRSGNTPGDLLKESTASNLKKYPILQSKLT